MKGCTFTLLFQPSKSSITNAIKQFTSNHSLSCRQSQQNFSTLQRISVDIHGCLKTHQLPRFIMPRGRKASFPFCAFTEQVSNEQLIDPVQLQLLEEKCILVDRLDRVIGEDTKRNCHLVQPNGDIKLHRAFSVFLFNSEGKLLLQKRSDKKITFPSMWTNTCCSHPLYCESELVLDNALGVKTAARRRLEFELGIPEKSIGLNEFQYITRIHYEAKSDQTWGEHEIDYILFLQKDLDIEPNENEIECVKYATLDEINQMYRLKDKYALTPWFRMILETLLPRWWKSLKNLDGFIDHQKIYRL